MKTLILLLTTFSLNSFAYDRCSFTNVTIDYQASTYFLTPPVFVVKENDRVCIRFQSVDSPKTLRLSGQPIYLKSRGEVAEASFVARKTGEIEVTCGGCAEKAKIVIQTASEFDAKEKEYYRYQSHENRRPHFDSSPRRPSGRRNYPY